MNRRQLVLAALSAAGVESYTPVQVQKLFFLIDAKVPEGTGGPYFRFKPYNYGPFDREVYVELERLAAAGMVEIYSEHGLTHYRVSQQGFGIGRKSLDELEESARRFIERAARFVRELSFQELVAAIYRAFPEMRENSVFQESSGTA